MEHTVSILVRFVVGLITAYIGGFLAMITGSVLVPPVSEGDFLPLLVRIVLIGIGTAAGAAAVWFNMLIDWPRTWLLIAVAFAGGVAAGYISYYWSDAFTGPSDLYIRVREITQSTLIGATLGANILAALFGFAVPRGWRN